MEIKIILSIVGLASFAGTFSVKADPIEDLAAQIKADHAYVVNHPQISNAEMLAEMEYRRAKINKDHAKDREVARELAINEAKKWDEQPRRIANSTKVGTSGIEQNFNNENPIYAAHRMTASEWLRQYFKQQDEKEQEFEADQLDEEKHHNNKLTGN